MIVCHPLRMIFIKTAKVGGTSFEIALSSLCCEDSVITPIGDEEEALRQKIGCPGAQNYDQTVWRSASGEPYFTSPGKFFNHISARDAKRLIPPHIWENYRKVSIVRDPFDVAISLYFFRGAHNEGQPLDDFVAENAPRLTFNGRMAPIEGEAKLDDFLRYERISEEVRSLGVPGLGDLFDALRMKGGYRPSKGATVAEMYHNNPRAADLIAHICRDQIDAFGYSHPLKRVA